LNVCRLSVQFLRILSSGGSELVVDHRETAMRHRDPFLVYVKINMFYDPMRKEPRFQAIERALNFPY
jgi:hypothetical protein